MDNRNKIIGIISLLIIILIAALAFYNYKGFHSVETGSTNASVPTEVASPPEGGS
ncbi:hypothetical protein [Legionella sp. 16cNR16C]|uniref:hypothetical protein n=1 Tax=Legionella sp. 16cNR16C TaxID=2905656 RepID=UPI001E658746|nr:hypothetical protein [Legionella sp. 16cNR16C]MCE3046056.1 hypothetical protein [Legionella sp. 16cNR16C]